jgi:hypothetical protein
VKTAQPFDRDNTAAFQHRHRRAQRSLAGSGDVARTPFQRWPAVRAGDRLGVKTAVGGIAVLASHGRQSGKCAIDVAGRS